MQLNNVDPLQVCCHTGTPYWRCGSQTETILVWFLLQPVWPAANHVNIIFYILLDQVTYLKLVSALSTSPCHTNMQWFCNLQTGWHTGTLYMLHTPRHTYIWYVQLQSEFVAFHFFSKLRKQYKCRIYIYFFQNSPISSHLLSCFLHLASQHLNICQYLSWISQDTTRLCLTGQGDEGYDNMTKSVINL
jgi:hypothetical protein